jgi:hypothetical protein
LNSPRDGSPCPFGQLFQTGYRGSGMGIRPRRSVEGFNVKKWVGHSGLSICLRIDHMIVFLNPDAIGRRVMGWICHLGGKRKGVQGMICSAGRETNLLN